MAGTDDDVRNILEILGMDLTLLDNENKDSARKNPKIKCKVKRGHNWWRTKALAVPNYRRLQEWPDPRIEGPPPKIRPAVCGRIPSRIEYLSRPKIDYYEESPANDLAEFEKWFESKDKHVLDRKRLMELSKPRPEIPEEIIEKNCFKSREQWVAYTKKLEEFAAHKREPVDPSEKMVRKKVPLDKLLPRLFRLSRPVNRPPNKNEKTDEEMSQVKPATLKYKASDRIKKLSEHKTLNEEALENLNYDPRKRFLRAKKYIASERIKELSKPIYRENPKENEVKENAFKVNPKALKARCSARLKALAKPIVRS